MAEKIVTIRSNGFDGYYVQETSVDRRGKRNTRSWGIGASGETFSAIINGYGGIAVTGLSAARIERRLNNPALPGEPEAGFSFRVKF